MLSRKMFYSAVLIVTTVLVVSLAVGCTAVSTPAVSAGSVKSEPPANVSGSGPVVNQLVAPLREPAQSMVRGITVVGTGKAAGTPDVAYVNIGVETQAETVQQAVADNKAKMTKLLDTLKASGIADKDIQTTNYGVYTQREPGPEGKGSSGQTTYHVNNQVNVAVRDVTKLGDVLDKVVAAGANNVYGVNFSVADTTMLQSDARAKAFADAQARAESLAKLAGVSLGDVVSVSEVIGGYGPIYDSAYKTASAGLGGGGAPVQPGELEVNMSIQVTFAIK